MREIKFRAWDKISGSWIEQGFHVLGEVSCFDVVMGSMRERHFPKPTLEMLNDVVLSQFTGLHDKNGKEIYEGDILSDRGSEKGPVCFGEFEYEYPGNDDYNDQMDLYGYYLQVGYKDENNVSHGWFNQYPLNKCSYYQVIGNIYENPELLKE